MRTYQSSKRTTHQAAPPSARATNTREYMGVHITQTADDWHDRNVPTPDAIVASDRDVMPVRMRPVVEAAHVGRTDERIPTDAALSRAPLWTAKETGNVRPPEAPTGAVPVQRKMVPSPGSLSSPPLVMQRKVWINGKPPMKKTVNKEVSSPSVTSRIFIELNKMRGIYKFESWDDFRTQASLAKKEGRPKGGWPELFEAEEQRHTARADAVKPAGFFKGMALAIGHAPGPSADHVYPPRVIDALDAEKNNDPRVATHWDGRNRAGMSDDKTKMIADDKQLYPTEPHKIVLKMIADDEEVTLAKAGIARCHKLADSSIYGILLAMAYTITDQKFTLKSHQPKAINNFAKALGFNGVPVLMLMELARAFGANDVQSAIGHLNNMTAQFSFNAPNLRFGYADVNTVILSGFDPNETVSGIATPLSEKIYKAVELLNTAGLISLEVEQAALGRVTTKGNNPFPLSSSFNNK